MPTLDQRIDHLEAQLREVLVKQEALSAQLSRQNADIIAQLSRQNADVMNHGRQRGEQISALDSSLSQLDSRMYKLDSRMGKLENAVEQGFAVTNQRLTAFFTMLGAKLE